MILFNGQYCLSAQSPFCDTSRNIPSSLKPVAASRSFAFWAVLAFVAPIGPNLAAVRLGLMQTYLARQTFSLHPCAVRRHPPS
jgi:hypothetical protein